MEGSRPLIPPQQEFDNTVKQILSRRSYSHLNNNISNFINKVKGDISAWLYEKFSNLNWDISPSISDNFSTVLLIIASLILIAIIVLVVVTISRGFEKQTMVKEIMGEKIGETTTPDSLRNKADQLQKKGDYRQAIRYDFIALLLLMHEKTILYLDKAKTNREIYLQLKENNYSWLDDFIKIVNIYNWSWYGHKQSKKEIYDDWNNSLNLLWSGVKNYDKK